MLDELTAEALLLADAGFVGYNVMQDVLQSGHQFIIRVGANVRLLRKLGYAVVERDNTVYLWPDRIAQQGELPIVLRLVVIHNGRHPVYLLTSVLDEKRLSADQVIDLYHRRWGIEVFYRTFKQTLERRKLRSDSPHNAQLEIEWSLLGLWALALYALKQQSPDQTTKPRLSMASALRAVRQTMRDYRHPQTANRSLKKKLRAAVIDIYVRLKSKASRNYPQKKKEQPPGKPQILHATPKQRQLTRLIQKHYALGLTA